MESLGDRTRHRVKSTEVNKREKRPGEVKKAGSYRRDWLNLSFGRESVLPGKNDLKSLLPFFFLWPFLLNNLSDFLQGKERSVSVSGVC